MNEEDIRNMVKQAVDTAERHGVQAGVMAFVEPLDGRRARTTMFVSMLIDSQLAFAGVEPGVDPVEG